MTEQPNETQAQRVDQLRDDEKYGEPLATLMICVYPTHTYTRLQANPGNLSYEEMSTELKVAANHLHRLAPDADQDVAYIDTEKL